jgi:hypothetical protein
MKVKGRTIANSQVAKELEERHKVRRKWHMQDMAVVQNLKLGKDGKPDKMKYK